MSSGCAFDGHADIRAKHGFDGLAGDMLAA